MVEARNCTNEKNHFSCKDYARVNMDSNPMKYKNVRQNVKCNQSICSGKYKQIILLTTLKQKPKFQNLLIKMKNLAAVYIRV